jgi:hypothetical protein
MANDRDTVLLETVKTHRARLLSAFLFGELTERRLAGDNVKRVIGSIVLAAVVCAGCVGFSLITSILARQAAARAANENKGPVVPGISDQPYAADYFDRNRRSGWGRDPIGNRWEVAQAPGSYSVRGGEGLIDVPVGQARLALLDVDRESADVTTTVALSELGSSVSVVGRRVGADDYRLVGTLAESRSVSVALLSRQERQPVPLANTAGLLEAYEAGQRIRIRMQVYGVKPAVVRAKVWADGKEEPQAWTVAGQDTYEPLQRGGAVGIGAGRPEGSKPLRLEVAEIVARPVFS